jgi:DNA-binding XRE family transcriptional regulator
MNNSILSNNIIALRKAIDLTQGQLATQMGVTQQLIGK